MKKHLFLFALLLVPMAALFMSCGSPSPTSANNSPTATFTVTSTPTPSVKTLTTFSSAVTLYDLTVDSSDNVYVCDYQGNNLDKITPSGTQTTLRSITSSEAAAFDGSNFYVTSPTSPYFYFYPNGGVTTSPVNPGGQAAGIAVNSNATTMCILEEGIPYSFLFYSLPSFAPIPTSTFTYASLADGPGSLAIDNSGNIYFAGTAHIAEFPANSSTPITIAGTYATNGYQDGTAATALFSGIGALAIDKSGNIYVADTNNNAIRKISGGMVSTLAGPTGSGVSPVVTFTSLTSCYGVAVDNTDNVFFTDRNTHSVYEYIP